MPMKGWRSRTALEYSSATDVNSTDQTDVACVNVGAASNLLAHLRRNARTIPRIRMAIDKYDGSASRTKNTSRARRDSTNKSSPFGILEVWSVRSSFSSITFEEYFLMLRDFISEQFPDDRVSYADCPSFHGNAGWTSGVPPEQVEAEDRMGWLPSARRGEAILTPAHERCDSWSIDAGQREWEGNIHFQVETADANMFLRTALTVKPDKA
ncbi:hypothetical protein B0H13DRAFT_1909805 [Mycena leptocephala]|nr:hypothetical protein B0H13DRAFT_1909805 [Mycena leptocephala]